MAAKRSPLGVDYETFREAVDRFAPYPDGKLDFRGNKRMGNKSYTAPAVWKEAHAAWREGDVDWLEHIFGVLKIKW